MTAAGIGSASAQTAETSKEPAAGPAVDDIIVTARKRDETSLSVPVAITAVGAAELQRRGATRLEDLNSIVPQLQIGESNGGPQGGTITLRGVGAGEGSVLIDQAVSFNIDGAPVARASVRRMSELDIQQIEVLKGPQALFFGKNSPGGIISIRTADPGNRFEAGGSAGYEFNADEVRLDGFISTPLTDTLGLRIAGYGSRMSGDKDETISSGSIYAPAHRGAPYDREYGGRLTLKFEPSDRFNARLKFNYGHTDTQGLTESAEFVFCPTGTQQYGDPGIACKPGGNVYSPQNPSNLSGTDYRFRDGSLYLNQAQILTSLEMNYKLSDQLTITSVTSYYDASINYSDNVTKSAIVFLPAVASIGFKEFNQELRLTSKFDGPLNFLLGGYYATSKDKADNVALLVTPTSFSSLGSLLTKQDGIAYSAFGQVTWNITKTLELAGGGRYSFERKSVQYFQATPPGIYNIPLTTPVPRRTFDDFSPEVTLTWRPTHELTVYGGYKRGFLSGGFGTGIGSVAVDRSYNPQKTSGFEGGVKTLLFNGTLRADLGLYDYVTKGLQLTIVFVDSNGNNVAQVLNVGKSTSKGIEGDVTWKTPLRGFSLNGGFGYNHSRYDTFTTTCYRGQTLALGCDLGLTPAGVGTLQDLHGAQIVRAPDWVVNTGATYETPIGGGLKLGISGNTSYTSSFFTTVQNIPGSLQHGYTILDASVRVGTENGHWELALLGKNLTNQYYFIRTSEASTQGTAPGGATGRLADLIGSVSRGRQIMLRATFRY